MTTLIAERVAQWQELVDSGNLVGRDLLVEQRCKYFSRGPIKKIWIRKDESCGYVQYNLMATLSWVARKLPHYEQWIWPNYTMSREISIGSVEYGDPLYLEEGLTSDLFRDKVILAPGNNLDPTMLHTEYFVEVQVAHHLYPPHPFSDIQRVGIVQNILPRRVQSQSEAEIVAITFALTATSYRGAKAWCIAECQRLGLPIVKVKKSFLLPGY